MSAYPTLSGRYRIEREIGRGGNGVVYEAWDSQLDDRVAIKTVQHCDADSLYHFKKEFRVLADLHHPNLIRLGELCCADECWFFTMEFVPGRDFLSYVRPRGTLVDGNSEGADEGTGFREQPLREGLRQLAAGVQALHLAGRIHRDIKPSNILVTPEGRVVILDFGLIKEVDQLSPETDAAVGTAAYMAPEQSDAAGHGPPCDWYSVGVVMYQALTGYLPFAGQPLHILRAKQSQSPSPPSEHAPGIPTDLDRLCRELMEREPSRRPSGPHVIERLAACEAQASADETATKTRTPIERRAEFVGRYAETAELRDALAQCEAGRGASVLIHGEPGVGKTALADHFVRHQRDHADAVVLSGRCYEQETLPFKAFDGIVDALSSYLKRIDPIDAASLLPPGIPTLVSMFPILQRVPAVRDAVPSDDAVSLLSSRVRAFDELRLLLDAVAERVSLILFIDDVQWADQDSLDLLQRLLTHRTPPSWLTIATTRAADQRLCHAGNETLPREEERLAEHFRHIHLGGLSNIECRDLLTVLWGGHVDGAAADAVLSEAHGHPFFLSQLAREIANHERAATDGPSSPLGLEELLWRRIVGCGRDARALLEVAAIAGIPLPEEILARVAEVSASRCQIVLGTLCREQFLRVERRDGVRLVTPYHDRVRETLLHHMAETDYEWVCAARVEEIHRRLGELLLERSSGDGDPGFFGIVDHFNAAGTLQHGETAPHELAQLNQRAGAKAQRATAHATALAYFVRGIELLAADAWDFQHEVAMALHKGRMEAMAWTGDPERSDQLFAELIPRATTDEEVVTLFASKIDLDTSHARFASALEIGRAGLARFGVAIPAKASPLSVMAEHLAIRWHQGRRDTRALVYLPETADPRIAHAMVLLAALAPAAYFTSPFLVSVVTMRIAKLSLQYGVTKLSAYGFAGYATILSGAFGNYQVAYDLGQVALELNERFDNVQLKTRLSHMLANFVLPWARPYAEAIEENRRAREHGAQYADFAYMTYAFSAASIPLELVQRSLPATQKAAAAAVDVVRRQQDQDMTAATRLRLHYYRTLQHEGLEAVDDSPPRLPEELSPERTPMGCAYYFHYRAILLYTFGHYRQAHGHIEQAVRREAALFGMISLVELWFFDALIAAQLIGDARGSERRGLARTIARRLKKLRTLAGVCPQNFESRYLLLRAENTRVRDGSALAEYEQAIASAQEQEAHGIVALGHELAAGALESQHQRDGADAHLQLAIEAYRTWGADAKAQQLEQRTATPVDLA